MITLSELNLKELFFTGIDFIDEDYKLIFDAVKSLMTSLSRHSDEICKEKISVLKERLENHFSLEEGYIRFSMSDSFLFHKHCHDVIKNKFLQIFDMSYENPLKRDNIKEILSEITGELAGHMLLEDNRLNESSYLKCKENLKGNLNDIEKLFFDIFKENLKGNIKTESFDIKDFKPEDTISYEKIYRIDDDRSLRLYSSVERSIVSEISNAIFKEGSFLNDRAFLSFGSVLLKNAMGRVTDDRINCEEEAAYFRNCDEILSKYNKNSGAVIKTPVGSILIFTEKL